MQAFLKDANIGFFAVAAESHLPIVREEFCDLIFHNLLCEAQQFVWLDFDFFQLNDAEGSAWPQDIESLTSFEGFGFNGDWRPGLDL